MRRVDSATSSACVASSVRPGAATYSLLTKPRPSAGSTRSAGKKSGVTDAALRCIGVSRPVKFTLLVELAAKYSNESLVPSFHTRKIGTAKLGSSTTTRASGSSYGSCRSITWSTTVKIVVLAPIPTAMMANAVSVKVGRLASVRTAIRKSFSKRDTSGSPNGELEN